MEWKYLTHIDTENLRIIIRAKGRHTNVIIGRPLSEDHTRVNPYFPLTGSSAPYEGEIEDSLLRAKAVIADHEKSCDAQQAAYEAEKTARIKSQKQGSNAVGGGLRELANRDATRKGFTPKGKGNRNGRS